MYVKLSNPELKEIGVISQKMVESRRDLPYPLVYKLIVLVLTLPIATALMERMHFSP